MQQGLDYAKILDIPCVFSSNSDGFLFHDCTNTEGGYFEVAVFVACVGFARNRFCNGDEDDASFAAKQRNFAIDTCVFGGLDAP